MDTNIDNPGEIWRLRREFYSLQRQLRSGQQKLNSKVMLLRNEADVRRHSPRLSTKKYRTKTSTPKVNNIKHPDRILIKKSTSIRKVTPNGLQHRHGRNKPRRQILTVSDLTSETESADAMNTSDTSQSEWSYSYGSPALRQPHRRSPRFRKLSKSNGKNTSLQYLERSCGSREKRRRKNERMREWNSKTTRVENDGSSDGLNGQSVSYVTPQPKSILLTPGTRIRGKTPNRVAFVEKLNQLSVKRTNVPSKDRSLLGYDWIAGVLESGSNYAAQSDDYFEEIREFRRMHSEICMHDTVSDLSTTLPVQTEPRPMENDAPHTSQSTHKCIHNYTVNERLFPVPLNEAIDGESVCAICQARKNVSSPAYIRVSIPRSTLASPYRVRSHRRRSYDPTDSLGLSQHCLAGWQSSKPSMMPTATNLDMKSSLGPTIARSNFDPLVENLPPTRRIPRMSRRTQELLNRSMAMQLDAQKVEKEGPSKRRPPRLGLS